MKALLIILFFSISLFTEAQQSVHFEQKTNANVNYLQFSSDSCSQAFIKKLNKDFGYQQNLIDKYTEAPNFDENEYSSNDIVKLIDSIRNGKIFGSLADIEYDTTYNKNYLLSFKKVVLPEGEKKSTNSVVSDYLYVFPQIYDLKHEKEIKSAASFLTTDGIKSIEKILKKVMCKRAKLFYQTGPDLNCSLSPYSLDEFMSKTYAISNNPSNIDIFGASDTIYYHFVFSENGMELSSSELDHPSLTCEAPCSQTTISWYDLTYYCNNNPDNIIRKICLSPVGIAEKIEWTVKSDFANLLDTPDELEPETSQRVIPYLVKGNKIYALAKCGGFLKVKYSTNKGKEIIGWILISDVE